MRMRVRRTDVVWCASALLLLACSGPKGKAPPQEAHPPKTISYDEFVFPPRGNAEDVVTLPVNEAIVAYANVVAAFYQEHVLQVGYPPRWQDYYLQPEYLSHAAGYCHPDVPSTRECDPMPADLRDELVRTMFRGLCDSSASDCGQGRRGAAVQLSRIYAEKDDYLIYVAGGTFGVPENEPGFGFEMRFRLARRNNGLIVVSRTMVMIT